MAGGRLNPAVDREPFAESKAAARRCPASPGVPQRRVHLREEFTLPIPNREIARRPARTARGQPSLSGIALSVKSVPLYEKVAHFRQDFCRKGTQRTQRQGHAAFSLRPLFSSMANPCLVSALPLCAAGRAGHFAQFCGKSSQVLLNEQLTTRAGCSQSRSIKPNQGIFLCVELAFPPKAQWSVGVLEYWVFPSLHHSITPFRNLTPFRSFPSRPLRPPPAACLEPALAPILPIPLASPAGCAMMAG